MDRVLGLVLVVLVQGTLSPATASTIDFHFTYEGVLAQGAPAATAQWDAQCVTGGEFADVARSYAPDPRIGVEARKAQAAKFDRSAFVRIATDAWTKANAALPLGPVRVCVDLASATDGFTRDVMRGVSAVTAGRGRITVRIHPDANWQAMLPYALAHEMHHSYWAQHHFDAGKPFTLADSMVLEGRADYFAGSLFPGPAPWTAPLEAAAHAAVWQMLSKQLNVTEWPALQAAMFGAPPGIPRWAGYSIGYRLVSERMGRAPRLDLKVMSAAPAAESSRPRRGSSGTNATASAVHPDTPVDNENGCELLLCLDGHSVSGNAARLYALPKRNRQHQQAVTMRRANPIEVEQPAEMSTKVIRIISSNMTL